MALPAFSIVDPSNMTHSNRYVMGLFVVLSSERIMASSIFSYAYLRSLYLLWPGVQVFCPFKKNWITCFLMVEFGQLLYILDTGPLSDTCLQIFSLSCGLSVFLTVCFVDQNILMKFILLVCSFTCAFDVIS